MPACYEAVFGCYGLIGGTTPVDCPEGATVIVPAPLPPKLEVAITAGFDDTLTEVLARLPAQPVAGDVTDRVSARLPVARVNPGTGHGYVPPEVRTAVQGLDVGVALWEGVGEGCLLGARIGGEVTVWPPSSVQLQPGELRCDAQTALRLDGLHAPR